MPSARPSPRASFPASRREFLGLSAGAVAAGMSLRASVAADADAEIRVGLVGCGGRGTGAAIQAAMADSGVRIVALGDAFADQIDSAAHVLAREAPGQFACPSEAMFCGADAYRRVLDTGVDAVLIAAPPHLRPLHVEAAVAAGAHVFCETPAAVDVPGALRVARALDLARAKGLTVVSGLHARRDEILSDAVAEIRAGAIGQPRRVEVHATLGAFWSVPVRPGWSAAESRLRNWVSSETLSGGHFVERHVHAIDRALWVLGDVAPDVAEPLPTRAGDGVAVRFVFADGAALHATSILSSLDSPATAWETVAGRCGTRCLRLSADGRRFQATMDAFLRSVRSGSGLDEGGILVRSSLVAIMGRLASAAGRPIGWREMLAADSLASPVRQIGRDMNLVGV